MSLHDADPRQLGPFRLTDRVGTTPEGVVYRARDSRGRRVSVAMLSSGAAADPAARDRFAAAVRGGTGVTDPPRVLASSLSSPAASWVAVRHSGSRGAEAYLEPVSAGEQDSGAASAAPSYAPYWAERGGTPAAAAWSWALVGLRRMSGAASAEPSRAGGRAPRGAASAGAAMTGGAAVLRREPGRSTRTGWSMAAALLLVLVLLAAVVTAVYLLLHNVTSQATPPPQPSSAPPSSPGTEPGTEPGTAPEFTPSSAPSGVPSVEVDEDDYPPGEVPLDPEGQA